jgi:hypothetical protein
VNNDCVDGFWRYPNEVNYRSCSARGFSYDNLELSWRSGLGLAPEAIELDF